MVDESLPFPDIMVDIETTGLNHNNNAILQIAAVKFNLREGTVSHVFFDRCLMIPPQRYWDEDCRNNFWLKDAKMREVLGTILGRGEDPETVLRAFAEWAGPNARFFGKPTHFDFAFLQNYYESFGLRIPFHYRDANDMNTWIRARYWPQDPPDLEREIEFQGDLHNGLHDALHQVKVLFGHKDNTKNQLLVP